MKYKNDVIVIGSGVGGLSVATYLSRNGYKVTIFENSPMAGGYVNTFRRGDYLFEATTHQLCRLKKDLILKSDLKRLGLKKMPLIELNESFEAIIFKKNEIKKRFFTEAGYNNALKKIISYFPKDEKNIINFFDLINNIYRDSKRLDRIHKQNPLFHLYDAVTGLCLLKGERNSFFKKIGIKSYRFLVENIDKSFSEIINFIEDPDLRFLLGQHCYFLGTSPEIVSGVILCIIMYFHVVKKPVFIKDGSIQFINGCLDQIIQNGGRINYRSRVEKIIIKDKKAVGIRLNDGKEYYAGYIVSNANAISTYRDLICDNEVIDDSLKEKIENYRSSKSVIQVYLGVPFDLRDYGYKASTIFFSPKNDLNDILSGKCDFPKTDSAFILTNYTLMDPTFSPKGKSSIVLAEFCEFHSWGNRDKKFYNHMKDKAQSLIIEKAKNITGLPLDKAETCFSATPKTMSEYSGHPFGAIVGADHTIEQSIHNRFDQKSSIENLFLVGQDTKPGGGVVACISSGIIAGNYLMKSK